MRKCSVASLSLWLVLTASSATCQRQSADTKTPIAIINSKHPLDSRGEVVYSSQTAASKDAPAVPGILIPPKPLKFADMEFPKNYRKEEPYPHVSVMGVVAANGDFIDLEIVQSTSPEASKNALVAAAGYKFRPATLDRKPVAYGMVLEFSF